ncbi:MAG: hypothetical protein ACRDIY_04625 [Chloroflexota bacterium]
MSKRRPNNLLLPLVPIVLLAAGVRILGLGNTDLWGDEAFSVMTALGPVNHLLTMLSTGEPHPPLYPFLLVVWLRLFGHSEFVARLPSAFAGIASVPVAAALARTAFRHGDGQVAPGRGPSLAPFLANGVAAATVVGLLVALNPIQVWYSQEARMYAQVSFFAGLATLALVRLWQGRRGASAWYVIAVLGAAGSHYYGLFVPVAHLVAVLAFARRRPELLRRWLRAVVVAGVLYLPWVVIALRVFTSYYGARPGTVDLWQVALSGWVRVAAGWSLSWDHAVLAAGVVTVLVLIGLAAPGRGEDDRFARVAIAAWLFTPFVLGFLFSLVRPMFAERYLVVSSLPFALLMARGITRAMELGGSSSPTSSPRRGGRALADAVSRQAPLSESARARSLASVSRSPGVLGLLIGAGLLGAAIVVAAVPLDNVWLGRYLKSAYNTHMRMVTALARPNDAVILDGTSQLPLYHYYLTKPFPTYPLPERLPLDQSATAAALTKIAGRHEGAWVFLYATPDYDPSYFIPRWLTANAYRSFDVWEVNGRLQYYRFSAPATLSDHPSQVKFGDSLLLQAFGSRDLGYAAGESIPIDLRWRWLSAKLAGPLVSMRLVDDDGLTWAQADQSIGGGYLPEDAWPTGQTLDDHHGLLIPPGTPPGTYHLLLNVYSADHPEPLPASGEGAPLTPGGVSLATIQVDRASASIWPGGIAGFQATTATFDGSVALLGYAGSDTAKTGESGYLTLIWKALVTHPSVTTARLELLDSRGTVAQRRDVPLASGSYPPTAWRQGDVLREQYHVPISAHLAAGTYRLAVQALPGSTGPVALGSMIVQSGVAPSPVAAPGHALDDTLGGAVALAGYDLASDDARPGATVHLALHWRDVAPLNGDYTVFVHVLDPSRKVVAQRDQPPAGGTRPTSSWFPGDQILDPYDLRLPANLAPGDYPIEVGMYNPSDGKRLPVTEGGQATGDSIVITTLRVGP